MRRAEEATATGDAAAVPAATPELSEAEFRAFYERTSRPLRAWLRRSVRPDLVEDLTQEAYLRLLRTPATELPEDERRAYLYRVATNLVNDTWRAHGRQGGTPVALDAVSLEARQENPAAAIDVARALAGLRLRERTLVWLAYVERASHREIAAALEVKEASVRVLLSRARHKLATVLGGGRET